MQDKQRDRACIHTGLSIRRLPQNRARTDAGLKSEPVVHSRHAWPWHASKMDHNATDQPAQTTGTVASLYPPTWASSLAETVRPVTRPGQIMLN
eukprot:630750-Pelagomonas_calceolata.AAC.1